MTLREIHEWIRGLEHREFLRRVNGYESTPDGCKIIFRPRAGAARLVRVLAPTQVAAAAATVAQKQRRPEDPGDNGDIPCRGDVGRRMSDGSLYPHRG